MVLLLRKNALTTVAVEVLGQRLPKAGYLAELDLSENEFAEDVLVSALQVCAVRPSPHPTQMQGSDLAHPCIPS